MKKLALNFQSHSLFYQRPWEVNTSPSNVMQKSKEIFRRARSSQFISTK